MATEENEAERKLRKLGDRLQRGWSKIHALTPEERSRVRQAPGAQWDQRAALKKQLAEEKERAFDSLAQAESDQEREQKKRQQDQSRGHGHSH